MSKNYFHEKTALNNVIGGDISLYFEPVFDPSKDAQNQDAIEFRDAVGSLVIRTGADEITWGYGLNTKRIPTYGGEVVQILSMFSDKMTIAGTCRTYNEQRQIYEYFKTYIAYTTGAKGVDTERHQKFLRFRYPARKWSFVIMVQDIGSMRMGKDIAAPTWSLTAEIVSENDRYALGNDRLDKWASVLKQPLTSNRMSRSGKKSIRGPKNFKLIRDGDPFGDLVDPIGRRGKIADNFDALVASWATGDITTLRNNPLVDPAKSADEIWQQNFGDYNGVNGGVVGGGGSVSPTPPGTGSVSYGSKKRVFATTFGGHGDASNTGHVDGQAFDLVANPDSYAELSTNRYNSANGTPPDGKTNDYAALGKLAALTPIRVTNPKNGKSMILYKRDVGFGGPGPDGTRGTADDPKIDIWHMAADKLDFNGFDYLDIEIGSGPVDPNQSGGSVPVDIPTGARYQWPISPRGSWGGGPWMGTHSGDLPNWESSHAADFMVEMGSKVVAVADGVVSATGGSWGGGGGRTDGLWIYLCTDDGNEFFYQHNQKLFVKQGQRVKQGTVIALSGAGNGAPHLHLGMISPINYYDAFGVKPRQSDVWVESVPRKKVNGLGKKVPGY